MYFNFCAALTNASTKYIDDACEKVFDSDEMTDMLENDKYDLVVVDILLNYCMLGLLPHFKAPYIFLTTMVGPSFVMGIYIIFYFFIKFYTNTNSNILSRSNRKSPPTKFHTFPVSAVFAPYDIS